MVEGSGMPNIVQRESENLQLTAGYDVCDGAM